MLKKITFYTSFKEQKRVELEEILKTNPKDRIARVVDFIRKTYPFPEKKDPQKKRIEFIRT